MAINENGKKLYVANGRTNDVSVIDLEKNSLIKTIAVGKLPWGVVIK
jgi:YVTN family beta-propeller protein